MAMKLVPLSVWRITLVRAGDIMNEDCFVDRLELVVVVGFESWFWVRRVRKTFGLWQRTYIGTQQARENDVILLRHRRPRGPRRSQN